MVHHMLRQCCGQVFWVRRGSVLLGMLEGGTYWAGCGVGGEESSLGEGEGEEERVEETG